MKPLKKINGDVPVDQIIQVTSNQRISARQRKKIQTVENVLLIWLDDSINMDNDDCQKTINQLQRAVNSIKIFTNGEECVQFVKTIDSQKVCMIISGILGQDVVPQIHHMFQVDTILIFCDNKQIHETWTKDWSKIKGLFTESDSICEALKVAAQQCEQSVTSITFMSTSTDISKQNLNQLDPSFMYSQILKEILLTINFDQQHINEFIEYCRDIYKENAKELKHIKQLETEYQKKTPIWWYTYDSFLYPMVNRALRLLDGDIIIKLGFFISDLDQHIKQLHREQFNDQNSNQTLTLYRGQGMSKNDFNKMRETKGGLLAFNCFLSTSKNQKLSLGFAEDAVKNPDLVGSLFVMNVDPRQSTTPFASVADVGYYGNNEEEILFSMHTVFRICEITPMANDPRIYQVDLTLTSDNDPDLSVLTNRIREEPEELTGWGQLGELLLKMGQSAKAQQVYEILLEQTIDEREEARYYHQLGMAQYYLGEHKEALKFYQDALQIRQKLLSPNDPDIAKTYSWIGNSYWSMGEYRKSLSFHEQALEIQKQSLLSIHPDLASSYMNVGLVYSDMGEYSKALSSYKRALEIRKQSLPANHPDLALSYNTTGNVYRNIGEYSKALSYYEKALEIRKQSLPSNHPYLAKSYTGIGTVFSDMGDYSKALSSYERALEIRKQSLPSNHPDLALSYNNIGNVYRNMGDYSNAPSFYEKALEIQKQSLSLNHPDLALSCYNIGLLYENMRSYSKAHSFYECAVNIGQQSLPSSHPDLENYQTKFEDLKKKL